jgi:hypothetical protein
MMHPTLALLLAGLIASTDGAALSGGLPPEPAVTATVDVGVVEDDGSQLAPPHRMRWHVEMGPVTPGSIVQDEVSLELILPAHLAVGDAALTLTIHGPAVAAGGKPVVAAVPVVVRRTRDGVELRPVPTGDGEWAPPAGSPPESSFDRVELDFSFTLANEELSSGRRSVDEWTVAGTFTPRSGAVHDASSVVMAYEVKPSRKELVASRQPADRE